MCRNIIFRYHVSVQGVDECMINVHYYYYHHHHHHHHSYHSGLFYWTLVIINSTVGLFSVFMQYEQHAVRQDSELNHVLMYLLSRSQCHVVRKGETSTWILSVALQTPVSSGTQVQLGDYRHSCTTGIVLFFL